jgi:hypothetical protein
MSDKVEGWDYRTLIRKGVSQRKLAMVTGP